MKKFSLKVLALVLPMILFGFTGKAMASDMIVKKAAVTNLVEKKAMNMLDKKMNPLTVTITIGWEGSGFLCLGGGNTCSVEIEIEFGAVKPFPYPTGFNPPPGSTVCVLTQHDGVFFNGTPQTVDLGQQQYPANDPHITPVQPYGIYFPAQTAPYSAQWGGHLVYAFKQ